MYEMDVVEIVDSILFSLSSSKEKSSLLMDEAVHARTRLDVLWIWEHFWVSRGRYKSMDGFLAGLQVNQRTR